jgi:hypothetical protein
MYEVCAIRTAFPGSSAVAGDFNLILDAAAKNNTRLNHRMMGQFRDLLNDLELKEQVLIGRRYTWTNERRQPTMERLDRWFCTVDWDLAHPECLLQALSSSMSDHYPIMMSTNISFHRKSRFHFQAHWPRIVGFREAVAAWWFAEEQHPDPFIDLQQRLKSTARVLTRWSQRRIGNVKNKF